MSSVVSLFPRRGPVCASCIVYREVVDPHRITLDYLISLGADSLANTGASGFDLGSDLLFINSHY